MSVQKYIVNKESINYTIIPNNVIRGLSAHLELLGIYLYLLSLPPNWSFNKLQLKQTCNIGVKKLENLLKTLINCNLIHVNQQRCENGRFTHFDITVYNGESFKINGLEKLSTPRVKNRRTVNGSTVKNTYKRKTVEIEKKEEIKERQPARKKRVPLSDYIPSQTLMVLIAEVSTRTGNNNLLHKFKAVMRSKGKSFSYDWDADLTLFLNRERPDNQIGDKKLGKIETKSTVKEYGPGHPLWEQNRNWELMKSHGSEASGSHIGGNGVRKAESYLLSK